MNIYLKLIIFYNIFLFRFLQLLKNKTKNLNRKFVFLILKVSLKTKKFKN